MSGSSPCSLTPLRHSPGGPARPGRAQQLCGSGVWCLQAFCASCHLPPQQICPWGLCCHPFRNGDADSHSSGLWTPDLWQWRAPSPDTFNCGCVLAFLGQDCCLLSHPTTSPCHPLGPDPHAGPPWDPPAGSESFQGC